MEATSEYDQIRVQNDFWSAWRQFQLQLHLSSCKTEPDEAGGHSVIQSSQVHDDRRTARDPELQPTACEPCSRSFKRKQEYKRHMKDVHIDNDQKPQCPLCTFKWTRPDKIKTHIISAHKECLAPDILHEIDALRGRHLTQYLDKLSQDNNREAAFQSIPSHGPLRGLV
ncbi:hypothetical protein BC827DRAFT_1155484 [Russula dissimulans]|nr:hypothetical protein BC827DRAFT_1155484 [Russula dissimulans]